MSDKNAEKYGSLESRSFQQIFFFSFTFIKTVKFYIKNCTGQPDIISSIVCDVPDNIQ